jgi:hypothetical protein
MFPAPGDGRGGEIVRRAEWIGLIACGALLNL